MNKQERDFYSFLHENRECYEPDDVGYIPTMVGVLAMAAVSAVIGLVLAVLVGLM